MVSRPYLSFRTALWTGLLSAVVILLGCADHRAAAVHNLARVYDFRAVLAAWPSLPPNLAARPDLKRLKYLALAAEGYADSALASLSAELSSGAMEPDDAAQTAWESARILLREIDHATQALPLLDSATSWAPRLGETVLHHLWERALEYLDYPHPGGYELMRALADRDPFALGRLSTARPDLHRRYLEIAAAAGLLRDFARRRISSLPPGPTSDVDFDPPRRPGWTFTVDPAGVFTAVALPGNPASVPSGLTLSAPTPVQPPPPGTSRE